MQFRRAERSTLFADLPSGEVFCMDGDASMYMKLMEGNFNNAVDLATGRLRLLSADQKVHPLVATLVVNG